MCLNIHEYMYISYISQKFVTYRSFFSFLLDFSRLWKLYLFYLVTEHLYVDQAFLPLGLRAHATSDDWNTHF